MMYSHTTGSAYASEDVTAVDWGQADRAPLAFACRLIQHVRRHPTFRERGWLQGNGDLVWRTPDGSEMVGSHWQQGTQVVGAVISDFFLAINASEDPIGFRLPVAPPGKVWVRVFDSDRGVATGTPIKAAPLTTCSVGSHSLVVYRRRG